VHRLIVPFLSRLLLALPTPPCSLRAYTQAQNDEASFTRLENAKDRLAEAMRATVLAARAINTEDIVRNQLAPSDDTDDEMEEGQEEPYSTPTARPVASSLLIGARPSAPASDLPSPMGSLSSFYSLLPPWFR
jgi:hypothetical protein